MNKKFYSRVSSKHVVIAILVIIVSILMAEFLNILKIDKMVMVTEGIIVFDYAKYKGM